MVGSPSGGLQPAIRAEGVGRLTFSIPVAIPAVAALPAAYKRAADARRTLSTSHNCRGTSSSCRPLSSSSIAGGRPAGQTPPASDASPALAGRAAGLVRRRRGGGGGRPGQRGPAAQVRLAAVLRFRSGGLAARRPVLRRLASGNGPAASSSVFGGGESGKGRPIPAALAARIGSCQARLLLSAPDARIPSAPSLDPLRLVTRLTAAGLTTLRMERLS